MIEIKISHCNNINDGKIFIHKNKLNIKYGINGTGKTTISKAIKFYNNREELTNLTSFGSELVPNVECSESVLKTLVFDEEFVNQVVFQENEVIENTFEIFIKTKNYDIKKNELDSRLEKLKKLVEENADIIFLKEQLQKFNSKFSLTSTGSIIKRGTMASILTAKNIYNIPAELESYRSFIDNDDINIQWIDWKNRGDKFDVINKCPYCAEKVPDTHEKKKEIFSKTYKKSDSQNLKEVIELLEVLKAYMNNNKYDLLMGYIKNDIDNKILYSVVKKLYIECDLLISCFNAIIDFGKKKIVISDITNIGEQIKQMKIPTELIEYLGGEKLELIINKVNDMVLVLEGEINILKSEIGALKGLIKATITESQNDINLFLKSAGINYELEIQTEDEMNSKTILKQCFDSDKTEVSNIRTHLSWGEKNAFSLILFMYYAIRQNPDLIILDDPISSFDSNKKFAILHRMFKKDIGKKDVSLSGKTVLLLTHDFEPITDFIIVGKLSSELATASYIWNSKRTVAEREITAGLDVKLITLESLEIAKDNSVNIISRITHLRKYCELQNKKEEYSTVYEILSCLIHGTGIRRKVGNDKYILIDEEDIEKGIAKIKEFIPDFDYEYLLTETYTEDSIIKLYKEESNSYFKIEIFRALTEISNSIKISSTDNAWFKFIDETYHIENNHLHYLDVRKFNIVPDYIENTVENIIKEHTKKNCYI